MRAVILTLAAAAFIGAAGQAQAGISYDTAGSTYSQNFNGLPSWSAPNGNLLPYNASAHIQTNSAANGGAAAAPFPGGWMDNGVTNDTYLGLQGWYLWHDQVSGAAVYDEDDNFKWYSSGGVSGHAHFRYGGGNAATGTGFFLFLNPITQTPLNTEKALGIRSSSFFTDSTFDRNSYIGLQLINNTGQTLDSFTITYDGEQYSEVAGTFGPDGFDLQWSLTASDENWWRSDVGGGFLDGDTGIEHGEFADSFLSPYNNNAGAAALVGNNNREVDITHVVSGINWAPGAELWVRWRDHDVHDGIAIDNVRFSATATPQGVGGDFNGDTIVDGHDFLAWQRGESPNGLDAGDLQEWKDNFPASVPAATPVPEPATWALCALAFAAVAARRRFIA